MKRLIILAGLMLTGCASMPSDQYDIDAQHQQVVYLKQLEEQDKQLAINLQEREIRNKQEAEYKAWAVEDQKRIDDNIAKQEAESFSYNIGRGLGITSKCAQARMSNNAYYNVFRTRMIEEAKKNPNYDAAKVQAGFEEGVAIGSNLMHTNPYMMLQGCSQMNAAVEQDQSVNQSKVSDFR
ncbi:hypothetical protein Ah1_00087 [Aeromonas phage Ah1]|uniref:Lipoprotein n=1 Tax=Aeromonas phage Ah1 TaxID=2053701 RepID=A0A2H4YEM2_9CAUD|nr:hypothetical protein KNT77_gp087 [Aeromonas phage Ah1]AUE22628.1 hypothetical protein Ah1_00087 [Aeromonas phage Ah1]